MTNIKPSWRALIDKKIIKRTDNGMAILPSAIRMLPDFNLRDTQAEGYQEDMDALYQHMARGGKVPALEVVLSADGEGVDVVEGHRRTITYLRLIEAGHPIPWVRIEPFDGNEIERVARIMTSQEGRKLLPLEVAAGYRRLAAFGLTTEDIARRVCKTRQHVDQMLILDAAPVAIQSMVKAGSISASLAVSTIRQEGEAGATKKLGAAQAEVQGKKITPKALKPWTPPTKYTAPLAQHARKLLDTIQPDILKRAGSISTFDQPDEVVAVNLSMRDLFLLVQTIETIEEAREAAATKARQAAEKAAQAAIPEAGAA